MPSQIKINSVQSSSTPDLGVFRERAIAHLKRDYVPWYERIRGWLEHRLRLPRIFHISLGVAVFLLACWSMVPLGAANHFTWYWALVIAVAVTWAYGVWFLSAMREQTLRLAPKMLEVLTSREQIDSLERCWALMYVSPGQLLITIVFTILEIVLLFISRIVPLSFFGIYVTTVLAVVGLVGGAAIWVVPASLYLLHRFAQFEGIHFNWLAPAKSVTITCIASYYIRQAALFAVGSIQWDIAFALTRVEGLNRLTWPFIGSFSIIAGITLIYNPLLLILPTSDLKSLVRRLKDQVKREIEQQIVEIRKRMVSGESWSESLKPYQELLTEVDGSPNSPVYLDGILRFLWPQVGSMLTLLITGTEYGKSIASIIEWLKINLFQ